jgi:hypothetical protein
MRVTAHERGWIGAARICIGRRRETGGAAAFG